MTANTYHGTFSSSSSYPFRPYEADQLGQFETGKALSTILHLSQIDKEEYIPEIRSLHDWWPCGSHGALNSNYQGGTGSSKVFPLHGSGWDAFCCPYLTTRINSREQVWGERWTTAIAEIGYHPEEDRMVFGYGILHESQDLIVPVPVVSLRIGQFQVSSVFVLRLITNLRSRALRQVIKSVC